MNAAPKQVFQCLPPRQWIRFDVEENVSRVRRGKQAETETRLRRQELVERPAFLPSLQLDPCLSVRPGECFHVSALGLLPERRRLLGELAQRAYPLPLQLRDVQGTDTRDEAEVVIGVPASVALHPPAADVAVGHGVRVRRCWSGGPGDHLVQPSAHQPVVGGELVDTGSSRARTPAPVSPRACAPGCSPCTSATRSEYRQSWSTVPPRVSCASLVSTTS